MKWDRVEKITGDTRTIGVSGVSWVRSQDWYLCVSCIVQMLFVCVTLNRIQILQNCTQSCHVIPDEIFACLLLFLFSSTKWRKIMVNLISGKFYLSIFSVIYCWKLCYETSLSTWGRVILLNFDNAKKNLSSKGNLPSIKSAMKFHR